MKRKGSFHTRIFLTVFCVALVPIILCFALLLPALISSSASRQAVSAQRQMEAMCARLGDAFMQAGRALDALAADGAALDAVRGGDGRAAYGALVREAPGDATQLMLLSSDGACVCALRGEEAGMRFPVDWGVLRMAQDSRTVYCGEPGRVLVARRLGEGYALAEIGGDALSALLTEGRDPSCGAMLLDPAWRLIDDSQAAGSEARLNELRGRLLAGLPLDAEHSAIAYSTMTEPVSGFTLLLSQPKVFTAETTRTLLLVGVALGALSLALCLWGAWVLSRTLSSPIGEMTEAMEQVERGALSVRLTPRADDELGRLAEGFNRMAGEYEQNLRRSVERQRELNDTRIRMMQAQLNPHFLYNTLDSMKWMGVTHHVPQVATLAEDLAQILRTSISGAEFVPLEQELELVERYIDIQLIRFEDRFACEIEVDDALMRCMVPKLVLQPLVENAVIHGVRDLDDGYIKIWAAGEDGELRLYVQDNGRGMDREQNGPLSFGVSGRPGEHLGLYNVDSILRLHFGDAYGLSVRSRPGEGCLMMVRLPMKAADACSKEENG